MTTRAPRPRVEKTASTRRRVLKEEWGAADRAGVDINHIDPSKDTERTTVAYCSRKCRDRAWYLAHGDEHKRPTKGEP